MYSIFYIYIKLVQPHEPTNYDNSNIHSTYYTADGGSDSTIKMLKILYLASEKEGDCPNPCLSLALKSHFDGKLIATEYLKSLILNVKSSTDIKSEEEKKFEQEMSQSRSSPNKISLKSLYGCGRRSVLLNVKNIQKESSRSKSSVRTTVLTGQYYKMNPVKYDKIICNFVLFCSIVKFVISRSKVSLSRSLIVFCTIQCLSCTSLS